MVSMKIKKKISGLINKGMTEMAFSKKENADYFKKQMRMRGFGVGTLRSSGPTVETPRKRKYHAYYVIAEKKGWQPSQNIRLLCPKCFKSRQ